MSKHIALILILSLLLSGCQTTTEATHLSSDSANAVMDQIRASEPTATFDDSFLLACTVTDNSVCDVIGLQLELSGNLSERIVDEVGPKSAEHSDYNMVQIRCEKRSTGLENQWNCEINRGSGWQTLPAP